MTRNASRQLEPGHERATPSVGKLADLAILIENPLNIDPTKIYDVGVLESIKGGKAHFTKP